eukprot:3155964-Prymnesium_polylepis.1
MCGRRGGFDGLCVTVVRPVFSRSSSSGSHETRGAPRRRSQIASRQVSRHTVGPYAPINSQHVQRSTLASKSAQRERPLASSSTGVYARSRVFAFERRVTFAGLT